MGGPGRGRHSRGESKQTVEQSLWIDIQEWGARDLLYEGATNIHWGWPVRTGLGKTKIKFWVAVNQIYVEYLVANGGEQTQTMRDWIHFEATPCHFGGKRWWFRCPHPQCGRRVRRLYRGQHFYCRTCHQLNYQSQHEDRYERLCRKAQKIRVKLGGSNNLMEIVPWKPKGMHSQTYDKLVDQSETARIEALEVLGNWMQRRKGPKIDFGMIPN